MKRIQFLRKTLDSLPLPADGQRDEYQSITSPELLLRVTSAGTKTFCLRRKINGRAVRVTLGTYMRAGDTEPVMTVAQAERAAVKAKAAAVEGKNPNEIKRARRIEGMTLRAALAAYVDDNAKMKPATAEGYREALQAMAPDWMDKPLRDITADMVLRRQKQHGERSHAGANLGMRVLRAVWNYARSFNPVNAPATYGDNPVAILAKRNAWFPVQRRRTRIKDHALPDWWAGVQRLRTSTMPAGEDVADMLTVLLYTGLRPGEASGLEWRFVDLQERTIEIPDPKNREPHVLPIPDQLFGLFQRRQANAISDLVFPSVRDPKVPMPKPTLHAIARTLKSETGVEFTPYDLRRGFATVAEGMDISAYTVKRLMNHRTIEADVTAGYVGRDGRRLAEAMQRIADKITELTTITESGEAGSKRATDVL